MFSFFKRNKPETNHSEYELSVDESFDLVIMTLGWYDEKNLELPEEELLGIIFEELDGDAFSFLHSNSINRLIEKGLIPAELKERILDLREKTIELFKKERTVEVIQNDEDWKKARSLAFEIREEIKKYKAR